MRTSHSEGISTGKAFVICLISLLALLAILFHKSFDPSQVLFANDGPLGAMKATMNALPEDFSGNWQDLNWIGGESPSAAPDISAGFATLFPPEIFMKFFAPITLLILGLSAWLCFRELGFRPIVCILGGLAAGLNMHVFSIACWGLGTWVISFAMMFLAVAALVSKSISQRWIRGALAGVAVGLGLMEGFDVGAILSLYVGAFGLFVGLAAEKISGRAIVKSISVMVVVVAFSALTAAHTIYTLVGTQVTNVAIAQQDTKTKEERWIWATQWSLPKLEVLRVIIPGIFGYRMVDEQNRPYEKSYWGAVAQDPNYEKTHQGYARHSGSGEYSGIFVFLVAILAIAQSFRKQNSPFSSLEKKYIWFWAAAALVSLLLALGRHAPFYQVIFALPHVSTIRNPTKFMHPFHIALLILFGYGLESMARHYLDDVMTKVTAAKKLLLPAAAFEKKWSLITCIVLGVSMLAWMVYASSKRSLIAYLVKFDLNKPDPQIPARIADFSMGEMGWFVLFFAASVALVIAIFRRKFAGKIKLACFLMGALIVADLAHADVHWIVYQNYKQKYASNPIVDFLKEKSYEHRVTMFPFQVNEQLSFLQQLHYLEWLQHLYPYYNIQSLDVAQEPRTASDNDAYRKAFQKTGASGQTRMWQLTNVRYQLGLGREFVEAILNSQFDPQKRFRVVTPFTLIRESESGPYLVQTNSAGPFALIEFTGALPRAKLYSNWEVVTNDQSTLEKLADPAFDPFKTVLIASPISAKEKTASTNSKEGSVEFTSYQPKRIGLNAKAEVTSVLLLNDKYDPKWKVFVDGQEKPVLRSNYIMRGVLLEPGQHKIEFRFQPPLNTLYVSLATLVVGMGLCAFVAFRGRRQKGNIEQ